MGNMDSTPPPMDYRGSNDSPSRRSYATSRSNRGGKRKDDMDILNTPDSEHKFVSQVVSNNDVVVFSKTHCPHCTDTKNILTDHGVRYKTVELDKLQQGPMVQNVLQEMTQARTVPRIFIDGNCVGGNSDLKTLDATGKLDDMLKDMKMKSR